MLAIDLDTALVSADGRISDEDGRSIQRARDAGVRVVLATGRLLESARRTVPGDLPIVAADGAQIALAGSQVIATHALPGSRAASLIELFAQRRLDVLALGPDALSGPPRYASIADVLVPWSQARFRAAQVPVRSVLALFAIGTRQQIDDAVREMEAAAKRALTTHDVVPLDEDRVALRVRGAHATRARALGVLATRWDVRRPACAYIGSAASSRDLETIAWAGRSLVTPGPAARTMPCVTITKRSPPGAVAEAIDQLLRDGKTPIGIDRDVSTQRATCHQPAGK